MSETHAAKPNYGQYLRIFAFLAVLTVIEVIAAFQIATKWLQVSFLILLAIAKAGLVASYYMHLRFEKNALRVIALAPLVLVALLTTILLLERLLPR